MAALNWQYLIIRIHYLFGAFYSFIKHTAIPWSPHIRYLGLVLDSKLLFKKHLHTATCKATGAFLQLFPLLARGSTLSIPNKLTLYKLWYSPYTHIRRSSLEQYITLQLSPTANFTVQMSPRHWQLPQTHPHTTSSYHLKRHTYPRLHLPFDC